MSDPRPRQTERDAPINFTERAHSFASGLTDMLQKTIGSDVKLIVVRSNEDCRIGPGPMEGSTFSLIPLCRLADANAAEPPLALRVFYRVRLNNSGQHLKVMESSFALMVKHPPTPNHVPIVRVEYDRGAKGKSAAHVHFHADSADLARLVVSGGGDIRTHHGMHFPLGSHRFRPSLEEFLKFLADENLFDGWTPGSNEILADRISSWLRMQAGAVVENYPEEAALVLGRLGWTFLRPTEMPALE